jgi:hypothetical protein
VKFPYFGRFGEISVWGMVWRVREDHLAGVCSVGLTRFKPWAGKIWG